MVQPVTLRTAQLKLMARACSIAGNFIRENPSFGRQATRPVIITNPLTR